MELTLIILVTEYVIISAIPIEQYHGVPSTHLQPVYWLRNPSSGQLPASSIPQVASYYREVPSVPSTIGESHPSFPQYKPSTVITSSLDVPTTRIDGYLLQSPPSDIRASNVLAPTAILSPNVFEQRTQTPVLSDEKIPLVPSDTPLESVKENKTTNVMPQVTIFAPGSLIDPDLFLNVLRKSLGDSKISVFVYAPGALFTSQDEATVSKPFLGLNHLTPDSSKISVDPKLPGSPKKPEDILSNTANKETESEKGTKESEEDEDNEKEKDD